MCGIAGLIDESPETAPTEVAKVMRQRLTHRGPDDHGVWGDENRGIGLGHCRLSIIDLSPAGSQPMVSSSGRFVLTYNGEIYNHLDLRHELGVGRVAPPWRGHSDTETLLAAIEHWGFVGALKRINGMFAFALWDRENDTLHLARDRLGEKPLYYGRTNEVFVFASELSALRAHPRWSAEIDPTALALYLRFGYVPAPWSIFSGISKLRPGHYVEIRDSGRTIDEPVSYWSLQEQIHSDQRQREPHETTEAFHELLRDSVRRRMQADVPVGSFLSGGIDSSTVTSLMQSLSSEPVKTFTIGFREKDFDEASHAERVAHHLGTDHTDQYLDPAETLATVPDLASVWDEPFADPSQVPTLLVSRLAGKHVKVVLSGDGGDELLHGYRRYARTRRLWNGIQRIPASARTASRKMISRSSLSLIDNALARTGMTGRIRPVDQRRRILAGILSEDTRAGFYERIVSHWDSPSEVVLGQSGLDRLAFELDNPALESFSESMMWIDTHLYLPDDILVKLDRASMSVGLEARVPLLDHRLIEFAWNTPAALRVNGKPKMLLKQVLHKYVPAEIVERPKMGFGVPIEQWLRGPLREWAEDLLAEENLKKQGYLEPGLVRDVWSDHLDGRGRHHFQIWDVLMFQTWLDNLEPNW